MWAQIRLTIFATALILAAATGAFLGVQSLAVPGPSLMPPHAYFGDAGAEPKSERASNQGKECGQGLVCLLLRFGRWLTHDATGVFTIVLCIITGLLARYTYRLWKDASQQFSATNRARIEIKHVWLKGNPWDGPIFVDLVIVNRGLTTGTIQQASLRALVSPLDRHLPREAEMPQVVPFLLKRHDVLDAGMNVKIPNYKVHDGLETDDWMAVKNKKSALFVLGHVDYFDSAGRRRKKAFCRRLNYEAHHPLRFVTHEDPDYEYED